MKKIFIVLALVVVLAVPLTAFAATSDAPAAQAIRGFCGLDASNLTDQQKADLEDSYSQMIELRKQSIDKMVENGSITKEQGDAAIKRLEDMEKYRQDNGFTGGRMGRSGGMGGGCGAGSCTFDSNTSS